MIQPLCHSAIAFCLTISSLLGQSGGTADFLSLNQVNNARSAALGGYNVSLSGDLALFQQNPALLDTSMHNQLAVMYNPFFANIQSAHMQYGSTRPGFPIGIAVNYLNYGEFEQTDATGAVIGSFRARDFVISAGGSTKAGPVTLGASLKFVHSSLVGQGASALGLDLGGLYVLGNQRLTAGMVIRNLGVALSDFEGDDSSLPLQIQAGLSFKPEHMPVRFSLTGHHLTDADNAFFDSGVEPNFADRVFTRMTIGGEILISRNFNVLIGYDHNRKRELRLEEKSAGAGWSYGVMISIREFEFRFSRATYHAAGGSSFISISTNTNRLSRLF